MPKCVFCGKDKDAFRGLHLIRNDGSITYFCSSKCRRNALNLKRDKRKVRWAEAFHITREKARGRVKEKAVEGVGK